MRPASTKAPGPHAAGGLTTVIEPDPNNATPSSNPVTYYTLNGAGQIVGVSVQRGGVAQNRSFTWSGTDLASATDPETGTTSYQHDGNHHVTLRTDAKGQQTRYTYDSYERLIETQYYTPTGSNGSPGEVTANRVTYGYDTNPNNPYDYYTWGRLTQVSFSGGNFSYYYDYNQAGRVTANQFMANNGSGVNLKATYAWDTQGRMTNMTYPSGASLNDQYDSMGRLSQIASPNYPNYYGASATATYTGTSQLSTLTYGAATGQIFTETRTYNTLMQLTQLTNTGLNMQYNYTAGHNNGRVAQTVDSVLGETVNYTYDMWNRLTAATATNGNWGEQYTFDDFGNLTGKTPTAGSAPAMNWPGATNQTSGTGGYDGNGNPVGYSNGGGPGYLWDVENHLATDQTAAYTPIVYIYDPWGRRVWKQIGSGRDNYGNPQPYTGEVYFYGATGQKLETYSFTWESSFGGSLEGINIYFGKKLLQSKGVWVATDKLGSVRANSNGEAMSYWPYGEERDSTANGREKFATYTRDGVGQDYAEQRYYNSSTGAFWTPDPGGIKTADPRNPSSWNRYPYVSGDPANHSDPGGMEQEGPCGPGWQTDPSLQGPCCDPSQNALLGAALDPACYAGEGGDAAPVTSAGPADPTCSDWGCMPAALARAIQALSNENCMDLFGTATTRAGAFNPVTVLESLFSTPAGGSFGSTSFQNKGPSWGVAQTSPVITKNPFNLGRKVHVTINSYTGANGTYWNDGNTDENASTLLHELGHVFNFLRGSGGFAVSNLTELKNPYAFDQAIQQNCIN